MKQTKTILAVILLVVLAGCGENIQSNNDLIIVDVSKSYPKQVLLYQINNN
uniref:hypothetical protein n=1 Tax=Bacteroides fragilis TaxID=817 RepID=UPI0035BE40EA